MIDYRWAEGQLERLPELAADLVRRHVNVIAAFGGDTPALAAKTATATIPIVFLNGSDPIKAGLVTSLNRPGWNVLGISLLAGAVNAKRLELIHELVPQVALIAVITNPLVSEVETRSSDLQEAARTLGLQLLIQSVRSQRDLEMAFSTIPDGVWVHFSWMEIHFLSVGAINSSGSRPTTASRQCTLSRNFPWLVV